MKNISFIAAVVIFSSACAGPTYKHPNKTEADLQRDKYECETISNQRASDMGLAGNIFTVAAEMEKCMTIKFGYYAER